MILIDVHEFRVKKRFQTLRLGCFFGGAPRNLLNFVVAPSVFQCLLGRWNKRQDGGNAPSLAADCEGGRAFHLGPEAEGKALS